MNNLNTNIENFNFYPLSVGSSSSSSFSSSSSSSLDYLSLCFNSSSSSSSIYTGPTSFICSNCTGIVFLPQSALISEIVNNNTGNNTGDITCSSGVKIISEGGAPYGFDCSKSIMNLGYAFSSNLEISGLVNEPNLNVKAISVSNNGCGNWGRIKIYGINYESGTTDIVKSGVTYRIKNFRSTLISGSEYFGQSFATLANFTGKNLCSGTGVSFSSSSSSSCPIIGLGIYLGNENAVTDDDIDILINDVKVGQYIDKIGSCQGSCGDNIHIPYCVSSSSSQIVITNMDELINPELLNIINKPENLESKYYLGTESYGMCTNCAGVLVLPSGLLSGIIQNSSSSSSRSSSSSSSSSSSCLNIYAKKGDPLPPSAPSDWFDCSQATMNLSYQFDCTPLQRLMNIKFVSAKTNGCGNWGRYEIYLISGLNDGNTIQYGEYVLNNHTKTLIAKGEYYDKSLFSKVLMDVTIDTSNFTCLCSNGSYTTGCCFGPTGLSNTISSSSSSSLSSSSSSSSRSSSSSSSSSSSNGQQIPSSSSSNGICNDIVCDVYSKLLDRLPSNEDRDFWNNGLNNGSITVPQMIGSLLNGGEFFDYQHQLFMAYSKLNVVPTLNSYKTRLNLVKTNINLLNPIGYPTLNGTPSPYGATQGQAAAALQIISSVDFEINNPGVKLYTNQNFMLWYFNTRWPEYGQLGNVFDLLNEMNVSPYGKGFCVPFINSLVHVYFSPDAYEYQLRATVFQWLFFNIWQNVTSPVVTDFASLNTYIASKMTNYYSSSSSST